MPKNRKLQNIIGTEHITDTAEAAIAAQATVGDIVGDTTPQLGGNLDVNGNDIVSVSNGDIELNPNGTGQVIFKGNATKGAGQFKLNCEQNSHGIVIKGPPHSAAASYTLTLPNTDGAANEVLKTDGSGNLDWVAQSSGGSPAGSDTFIQYNNGGSFGASTLAFDDTAGSEQIVLDDTSDVALMKVVQRGTGTSFEVHDAASDTSVFQVGADGKTSIGFAPGSGIGTDTFYVQGRSSGQIWTASTDGSASAPVFTRRTDLNTGTFFPAADNLAFSTGGSERLRVGSSGEIGIGGANYGTSGQVLTSGGSGAAVSWTTVSGGGGSGYMQAVTNWPNFSTNALIFVPSSNPPLTFDVLTVGSKTLSDDIQFTPWIFRQDTTIKEIGFRLSGTGNPAEMCVYESNSDGFPTNKVANSTATFASPSSGNNMATMAAGSGGITFSANELYWCAIVNTTTGANLTLTTHGNSGSVVGMPGGIYNRSTLQLVSGTVNALPSSIGTLSISASYQAFMAFAKKA